MILSPVRRSPAAGVFTSVRNEHGTQDFGHVEDRRRGRSGGKGPIDLSNRNAAYHCQQAAEKLIRVVLLHLEIEAGREHRLDVLLDKVPQPNLWKAALKPLEKYTPYATAFRYPTPGGRIPSAPLSEETHSDAVAIEDLIHRLRSALLSDVGRG